MNEKKRFQGKANCEGDEEELRQVSQNRFSRTLRFCLAALLVYGILTAIASFAPDGGFWHISERLPCKDHTTGASKIPLEVHIMYYGLQMSLAARTNRHSQV